MSVNELVLKKKPDFVLGADFWLVLLLLDDIAQEHIKMLEALQLPTLLLETQEELLGNLICNISKMFENDKEERSADGNYKRVSNCFNFINKFLTLHIPPRKIEIYLSNMGSIGTNLINCLGNNEYIEICITLSGEIGDLLDGIAKILPQRNKKTKEYKTVHLSSQYQ